MNYTDLKMKKIGDNVFLMWENMMIKATIIGVEIHPFPNPEMDAIKYKIIIPSYEETFKVDALLAFDSIEGLEDSVNKSFMDETITLDQLSKHNSNVVIKKLKSSAESK